MQAAIRPQDVILFHPDIPAGLPRPRTARQKKSRRLIGQILAKYADCSCLLLFPPQVWLHLVLCSLVIASPEIGVLAMNIRYIGLVITNNFDNLC